VSAMEPRAAVHLSCEEERLPDSRMLRFRERGDGRSYLSRAVGWLTYSAAQTTGARAVEDVCLSLPCAVSQWALVDG
jgi:hypothetical protein